MKAGNTFKNKLWISKNFLWIFPMLILYSCGKYSYHDTQTLPDGTVLKTDYIGYRGSDKFVGEVKAFYPSGELESHYFLINGKIDGLRVYYYKNGKIKGTLYFANGKRQGEGEFLYENGRIWTIENYRNDSLNGYKVVLYKNGKIDSELSIYRVPQYVWTFDSNGYSTSMMIFPKLKFPHEIHLGEKFLLEVTYQQRHGYILPFYYSTAIITENIENIDSMKDYNLEARKNNNTWEYVLRKNKIEISNFPYTVFSIPVKDTGNSAYFIPDNDRYGVYEFTPSSPGNYCIKGVSTSLNYYGMRTDGIKHPDHKDSSIHFGTPIYRDTCISINFKVIQ